MAKKKTEFLDKRNCYALLQAGHGLPSLQRLEECLRGINNSAGPFQGLIDKLIRHNQQTIAKQSGEERLLGVPLDIAQGLNISDRTVQTQARERPFPGPLWLHNVVDYENGLSWKTIVPLQFLLKGWGDADTGYQCYVHSIAKNTPRHGSVEQLLARIRSDEDTYYYVGITGRNWLERLNEHISETRRGSRRLFYEVLRESTNWKEVIYTSSLVNINQTFDDAMNWEERHVDQVAGDKYGMNMIPGGFKGLQYLHKLGLMTRSTVNLEERDHAISEFIRQNPRKGIPNPLMSELWADDDHYLRVMESREKTLSPDQVRKIRRLSEEGWSAAEIVDEVSAWNETQVKNVIAGRTYTRIR